MQEQAPRGAQRGTQRSSGGHQEGFRRHPEGFRGNQRGSGGHPEGTLGLLGFRKAIPVFAVLGGSISDRGRQEGLCGFSLGYLPIFGSRTPPHLHWLPTPWGGSLRPSLRRRGGPATRPVLPIPESPRAALSLRPSGSPIQCLGPDTAPVSGPAEWRGPPGPS